VTAGLCRCGFSPTATHLRFYGLGSALSVSEMQRMLNPGSRRAVAKNRSQVNYFHLNFFLYKTIRFMNTCCRSNKKLIKKSCVVSKNCDNSLGIPSNKKPESTENDSPSTSD
jgi:hypothetical protein